jgi:hypothetical protein
VCGSGEKGLEKAAFLLLAHVFMAASPFARRISRSQSQAIIAGNNAAHGRSRHPRISGNLFGFPRAHQGMVNDPPAFSNPIAWVHFHATFDVFQWNMSSGSCDSRSQNRSSSPPNFISFIISLGTRVGIRTINQLTLNLLARSGTTFTNNPPFCTVPP